MKVTFSDELSTSGQLLGPVNGLDTSPDDSPKRIAPAPPAFSDEALVAQIKKAFPTMTDAEVEEQIRLFW
jgi:hypothetical protein